MLLDFKVKNFRSYKEMAEFDMKADKIEDLKYSILHYKKNNKLKKALCSSVIYGPNASGKSNIIKAIGLLKNIVLGGNIRRKELGLELIPNINSSIDEPVVFEIEFIYGNIIYKYYLSINVGKFLSNNNNRYVNEEKLFVNDKLIYQRDKQKLQLFYNNNYSSDLNQEINDDIQNLLENSLVSTEIFLANGFKTFSKKFSQDIISWFENKLEICEKLEEVEMVPHFNKGIIIDKFSSKIAKESGITGSEIVYTKDEDGSIRLKSLVGENIIDAELFESYGTERIVKLMPIILLTLQHGSILIIDELDVALHPKVVMNIINLFHNDELNVNHAQLIFNTHNPIYLNNSIFRRDEIKFVEKENNTNSSIIYKLSDFGTVGKSSVRNSTNYIKNYFTNKYGAILNIDYTDIFRELMRGIDTNEKN